MNRNRLVQTDFPLLYQLQDREEAGEFTPEPLPNPASRHRAERFFAAR